MTAQTSPPIQPPPGTTPPRTGGGVREIPLQRWWDWPAALLILIAAITASTRLAATGWTNHLEIVQTIAFLGVLLGLALGQTRFSARLAVYLALAYGLYVIAWQMSGLLQGDLSWAERLSVISARMGLVVSQLTQRQAVQDSILFLALMSILFWVLSVHAGYTLTRHGMAWAAFLPMGMAMFVVHSFDAAIPRRGWYLAAYLFFGLVLVARMAYRHTHSQWQKSRTVLPPQLGFDFIRFGLLAASLVILLAWTVPAMARSMPTLSRAVDPLRQQWYEVRDRMDNAFASLRSRSGVASDYYGSNVTLGRGSRLSDAQVFLVRPPKDVPQGVRFYWRARVYDQYLDGQWLSTLTQSEQYNPEEAVYTFPIEKARYQGYFEFITADNLTTLFAPPQPLFFSAPGTVHLLHNSDDTVELASLRASPGLEAGTLYGAGASLSDASIKEMRESGDNYPAQIRADYLQLPDTITERTKALSQELTAGLDNPYDKVMAVTNYLRDNITYNETVPEVPAGQEPVDWFLFDYKKGFCNYYATAEVVLLRAAGIPARWAVGYAQGETQEDGNFLVRQREAHAWPEVYFNELGWVEFEPTVSQPAIERLAEPVIQELSDPNSTQRRDFPQEDDRDMERLRDRLSQDLNPAEPVNTMPAALRYALWALPLLLAGGLLLAAWKFRDRFSSERLPLRLEATFLRAGIKPPAFIRRWAFRASLSPLSRAYLEINAALKRLNRKPKATDTPAERVTTLGNELPPAKQPAEILLHEYQVAIFSPNPADEAAGVEAGALVRKLSIQKRFQRWFSRLQEPEKGKA